MMALLLLAIATPLLCALLALFEGLRNKLLFTLPWATFPALLLALTLNENLIISLPYGLTGVLLGMDEIRRIFLILAVLLWTVAGVYAIGYLQRDTRHWQFALCWLLTLSGNLGLILSFDALSFYSFFALMTFAGYGLVVHTASDEAFYAGRIYLIMAVIGEGLLLIGLLSAVFVAGVNADLNLLPAAIANAQFPLLISLFIFLGFGIKAGLPIFHLWLPLAHPVAPVPASAVLSGVMIKAGLLGWLVFLPLGEMSLPGLGVLVVGLGLIAAIGAAIIGICQCKAKTVLAYSSISQMGWMTMMVGLVLLEASMVSILLPLVALFALHHGLAKGALFLCVPMNVHRKWSWLWVLLPASSLMGLPFTSGALLKTEFKYFLDFQV
ncbi:MAG: NADH-ubiquinone oxidoreductase, partial [Oceanospirillales bacterium]